MNAAPKVFTMPTHGSPVEPNVADFKIMFHFPTGHHRGPVGGPLGHRWRTLQKK